MLKEARTVREDYKEAVRKVRSLSCEELYKLVDELRMVREHVHHLVTHFLLTGYINIASRELKRRCPELFEALTRKWREKELRGFEPRADNEICRDILDKLKETKQIYIVSHDYPISVSRYIFWLLDQKRRALAKKRGVPEDQYEFEDLFAHFLGISP